MSEPLLKVEGLKKYYPIRGSKNVIKACDGVSFELNKGETLAIVGESGCGKSTTVQSMLRMTEPTEGSILLEGEDFRTMRGRKLKQARQKLKLIFQDPYSSLNPRMTVKELIAEPLEISGLCPSKKERDRRVEETMEAVGLDVAFKERYPHEFSGGQRQRIGIARALILHPQIIVCDEPVSALDVSVQAKIINLLRKLQKEQGLSYIFISHDLGVVRHIADRVLVMYLGRVVEEGTTEEIYGESAHPYTRALLDSVPRADREQGDIAVLSGDLPSPASPPAGCHFHTRCPLATERCRTEQPELRTLGEGSHRCACFYAEEENHEI